MAEICACGRTAQTAKSVCWHCDESVPESEKKAARVKGGSTSKPIRKLLAIPAEKMPIQDVHDIKNLLNSATVWLLSGSITATQARAIVALANAMRECLELEMFAELKEHIKAVEQLREADWESSQGGSPWEVLHPESSGS